MNADEIFVIIIVVLVLSFRSFRPLVQALADAVRSRIESGRPAQGEDGEVKALRETVDSLSDEVARLTERVEFTERLLEKPREAAPETKDAS